MTKAGNPLALYNQKRDFKKTSEPAGTLEAGNGNRFLVQKHAARRLHFDLRLEMDGVLKSWAVTRGPSLNPDDKRLAVRTEDHPVSYAAFEGSIPQGEYGGGTVMLWDEGTWAPVKDKDKDLKRGHLHFRVQGKRMQGEWLLIRMRGKKGEKRENWLLRKIDDEFAGGSDDLVARELKSVQTGRSMNEIAADQGGEFSLSGKEGKSFSEQMDKARKNTRAKKKKPGKNSAKAASLPKFRKPQLASLSDTIPGGNQWLHEIKYDGYRCLLSLAGDKVRIYTRSGKQWNDKFPEIAAAATALDLPPVLIDGEVVKLDRDGNPDFSALQNALKKKDAGLTFFAFDLLEQQGDDLASLPTIERKERLGALLEQTNSTIRFADHLVGAGEELFEAMCKAGQEGIISKRADAPYRSRRTRSWLKVKCSRRQEFVIIGWRKSAKKGRAFSSLLLALHEDDELVYKGRVGTGFNIEAMEKLAAKMQRLERKTAPASVPAADARDATWLTPKLVAEVAFAEFTAEDKIRHGSFIGLRVDKAAREVTAEPSVQGDTQKPERSPIKISNADRIVFPAAAITKGELAEFYQAVGSLMLPGLSRRPVSLLRCPQGRAKKCFFQKHHPGSFGDAVQGVAITEKDGGVEDYLFVDKLEGIVACVQMGTIEFHGWGSRTDHLEQPDRMIFDLDPDEGLDFEEVKKAAQLIRRTLADIGLVSFAMLSGGKGVHVVVPLSPDAEWPAVKDFARRFATALAQSQPERFTATMSKAKRRGRIFIDWLRNQRGATSVQPYSVRAREGAPVATPVSWNELRGIKRPGRFTVADASLLLERANQAELKSWGQSAQTLPDL